MTKNTKWHMRTGDTDDHSLCGLKTEKLLWPEELDKHPNSEQCQRCRRLEFASTRFAE
jgi:hypothetical protein